MTIKHFFCALFVSAAVLLALAVKAQSNDRHYVTITKMHRDLNLKDASTARWLELEKSYLEKVITKNEFILKRDVLNHYMTEDNTEILYVQTHRFWDDIEKAKRRNTELEKQGWPNAKLRSAYLGELGQYFDKNQSDEIFMTVPGMKEDPAIGGKAYFYQMRVNHLSFPKDGTEEEFLKLNDAFLKKAVYNNEYIKGYYPFIQVSGSDRRQYIEIIAVESLHDLEYAFKEIDEFLYEPKKEDEARHTAFIDSYFKYFTGFHADYIYISVPELKR